MMTGKDVIRFLELWESAGIHIWVDGGWGVDALLGEQTRPHNDLDIAMKPGDLPAFMAVMEMAGFRTLRVDSPHNFVLIDKEDHEVDVHLADIESSRVDEQGIEVYGLNGIAYEVGSLDGTGTILGKKVMCCAAEFQYKWHNSGFEMSEDQIRDVITMHDRFGFPLPWPDDRGAD